MSDSTVVPRRVNPPHYFLMSLVLVVGLGQVPWARGLLPGEWSWLGVAFVGAGVLIAFRAARQFAQAGTNIVPLTKSTTLVTNGMFAVSRNPMYLGMVLTLVGAACLANAALPWIAVVAFAALLKQRFIRHEEALMEQTFGAAYRAYKARVRRWL